MSASPTHENASFNPDPAKALHSLWNCLSEVDLVKDASEAVQEAVELYRKLAKNGRSCQVPRYV